ncbi:MAG TPA: hypothetical protein VHA53_07265 [Nitrolancea sp.]|nr:hypothetical protein [Nitrolancea sp.]
MLAAAVAMAPAGRPLSDDVFVDRVLIDAIRVIALPNARLLALFHLDDMPNDPAAVGALMLAADGRQWQLRASTFVPRAELLPGSAGQIYGAAISDDEMIAALSVGWLAPNREGRNAIVILRKGSDRLFHPASLRRCDVGLGDLAFTANGNLAVVTRFTGRSTVITLFSPSGRMLGELFGDLVPDRRRSSDLQLTRLDRNLYGLVDVRNGTLYHFSVSDAPSRKVSGRIVGTVDLNAGLRGRGTLGPIQTVALLAPAEIMAVRQLVAPRPDTIVTIHHESRSAQWRIGFPSRTTFWDGTTLSIVTAVDNHPFLGRYSLLQIRKGVLDAS